jgi:choline dehydrogenase
MDQENFIMNSYDYVIAGAGSAGCVLAARLSEDPNVTVALLEAGEEDSAPEISMPLGFPMLFKTSYDWDFYTEPQVALGGRNIYLTQGKGIGGSSSVNAMVYMRGNPVDFDGWARDGAPGWSYRDMLPYFIKSEGNARGDKRFHGHSGPLAVQDARYKHPLADRFIEAGQQAGHPYNDDFNGATQMGVGRFQLTMRDGVRCSAADAYLHPSRQRPNLHILTGALVMQVTFDGTRATGVTIFRYGKKESLRADREVILSAGAFSSPQTLMLSGIGPASQLKGFGITPISDLPVGVDLHDHVLVPLVYLTNEPTFFRAGSASDFALYQKEKRGPMASNLVEAGAFLSTTPGVAVPDIELYMAPAMFHEHGLGVPTDDGFTIMASLINTTSRGKITLRSARPDAKPRIFVNVLAIPEDRKTMIGGVKAIMEIARQPALAAVRSDNLVPPSDSDADIWAYLQKQAVSDHHPGSTCAIGHVVDPELKVLGTQGLRVVDASVMPSVPRGNINAVVIAIAEKASDLILEKQNQGHT